MRLALMIILAAIGLLVAALGGNYVSMADHRRVVDSQWAQAQKAYQHRADLIPNLIATMSGAVNFDRSSLAEITQACDAVRKARIDPAHAPIDHAQLHEFEKAQDRLTVAFTGLLAVAKQHPEIKTVTGFHDWEVQFETAEKHIAVERQKFNEAVEAYNLPFGKIPSGWLAQAFGFPQLVRITHPSSGAETLPKADHNSAANQLAPAKP